jgi:mannose-1-phosphate guanylyltransferase/mannose-1-phosphate guanylyltransferase/phosphomannomutase
MVLAAGLGTRLRPITYEIPKPLAPVVNRPVMEHILDLLRAHGFSDAIANLSHLPEQIRDWFGDGSDRGLSLSYSEEEELLGTAGGVRNVAEFFAGEPFLVISGDALTDIDLSAMRAAHEAGGGIATLALKRVADTSQYGVVILGDDTRIQGFQEKPDPAEALSDLANCGIYMFGPEIFDYFPDRPFADWAMDVFPALLDNDVPFHGHEIDAYWNDIGSLDEFRQGNFDALEGAVALEHGASEIRAGLLAGEGARVPDDVEVDGPVLVGAGAEVGQGVRLDGPLVIGDGCRVGSGARIREAVLLPGATIEPDSILVGAIAATRGPLIVEAR